MVPYVGVHARVLDKKMGFSVVCMCAGLRKVTDAGLQAFSAALGSSSTITTVGLIGKV